MKKLISFLCAVCILCAAAPGSMAYFSVGPRTYTLENEDCTQMVSAEISEDMIVSEPGGRLTYDFYLPFDSQSVDVMYHPDASVQMTMQTESDTYKITLNETDSTVNFRFPVVERKGDRVFTLSFNGSARINKIVFNKVETSETEREKQLPALSDEELATVSTIAVDISSPVMLVRGSRRYVDMENIQATPRMIQDTVYLPVHSLARALGYYYEDMPDKQYILLRNETTDICFTGDTAYKQVGANEKEDVPVRPQYIDGKAYLPIRYFAELTDRTVGYQDGLVVIDTKHSVQDILTDENLYQFVREKLTAFYPQPAAGNIYHVAQTENASDANDGTAQRPFRTLNKAGETAQPGDTVIVHDGIYRETFDPKNNGTAANPIVYQAAEGENPVISANETVSNFVDYGDGMAAASVGWDLGDGRNQVFYQDKAIIEARYPNEPRKEMSENGEPLSDLFPVMGDFKIPYGDSKIAVSDTLLNQEEEDYWRGATLVSMQGLGWALGTAKVIGSEKGKLELGDTTTQWWFEPEENDKWNFGYLTGHIHCMDLPGEWIMTNGALLIIPPEGETYETLSVEVKKRQLVIDLADSQYIHMHGIDTIGGGIRMNEADMCMIEGAEIRYISHYTYTNDQREGFIDDQNRKDPNGAPPRGEVGIYMGGRDNIVANNIIDHSAAAGIYGVGLYEYIENNIISNCGYMASYISGITFGTEAWKPQATPRGGFAVYNNTVYNCGRSVLNMQANQDADWTSTPGTPYVPFEVAYNDFHDGVLFSLDTGITYEYCLICETDKQQSKYHNNYIYYTGLETNPFSFGLYHDNFVHGVDTFNNVVFTTQEGVKFSQTYAFKQPDAVSAMWDNKELKTAVIGGKDALTVEDFPYGKPFWAGSMINEEEYMLNYEQITSGAPGMAYYAAANAQCSEGVTIDEDGLAVFSGNDQWIAFEGVDFGEDGNQINIDFKGDKYNTKDYIEIIIGDSMETGTAYNGYLEAKSPTEVQNNTLQQNVVTFTGIKNVYIRMLDYRSAKIDRISVSNRGSTQNSHDGERIYGGEFNNVDVAGDKSMPPAAKYTVPGDAVHPMVNNTWEDTILRYNNVEVKEDASVLTVSCASDSTHGGQTVKVYQNVIGQPTKVYVGEFTTPRDGWDNYEVQYIPLETKLAKGTYDIYLHFEDNGNDLKTDGTSNFYYFGFLPGMPAEESAE